MSNKKNKQPVYSREKTMSAFLKESPTRKHTALVLGRSNGHPDMITTDLAFLDVIAERYQRALKEFETTHNCLVTTGDRHEEGLAQ